MKTSQDLRPKSQRDGKGFEMVSIETLRDEFSYEPQTGLLRWRKPAGRAGRIPAGTVAGSLNHYGYIEVRVSGKLLKAHRVIWALMNGVWPQHEIDHIDGDRSNNAWDNIREATHEQNLCNRGPQKNNTSGFKGVSWHRPSGKFRAAIKARGKHHYIGLFSTAAEASAAYHLTAKLLHGTFAPANSAEALRAQ
jgi:hypothetical protein